MGKLLTEFTGAMFLALVLLLGSGPVAVGAVLLAMIYMGRPTSGAHYNPAVTLGFALRGRIAWGQAGRYVLAQFAGAMFAAGVAWCLRSGASVIAPAAGAGTHQWYLAEIVFSFALCLVYFQTTDSTAAPSHNTSGIAIGFLVVAAMFAAKPISGAVLNPAVGIGPNLVALLDGAEVPGGAWLLYLVAPSIGATLATLAYAVQRGK
jgi:aquaporin Z